MNKAIIGKKIGMTQIFQADGKVIPIFLPMIALFIDKVHLRIYFYYL